MNRRPAMLVTPQEASLLFDAKRPPELGDVEQPDDAARRPTQDQYATVCGQSVAGVEERVEPTRVDEADVRQVGDQVCAGDVRPMYASASASAGAVLAFVAR